MDISLCKLQHLLLCSVSALPNLPIGKPSIVFPLELKLDLGTYKMLLITHHLLLLQTMQKQ